MARRGRGGRTDLQREEDHREADHCGDAHSHDHGVCVVEAGDHPHHVGQAQSQDGLGKDSIIITILTTNTIIHTIITTVIITTIISTSIINNNTVIGYHSIKREY